METHQNLGVSVVIPVKNENENLPLLTDDLMKVLRPCGQSFEIIYIDDGSTDNSCEVIRSLQQQHPEIRFIKFDRNYGKTAALQAGFERARGDVIIIMDGDRQNDPVDIPVFLEKIKEYDIVCGYRARRLDSKWRLIQSRIANRIRNKFTHDGVRDSGCGYQALRRSCLKKIKLYGGMHRFLPCLFQMEGFTFAQIPVLHHPRIAGVSNYPFWQRLRRAFLDLFAVRWMLYRRIAYKISEEWAALMTDMTQPEFDLRGINLKEQISPLLNSPLFLFLACVLIVYAHILQNGYECFRSDHITQIPLIFMQQDHTLFPRDWFLQKYGHFDLRFFHLFLIRIFSTPLGLPGGILSLYFVLLIATIMAWAKISQKIYNNPLPGLMVGFMSIFVYGLELGTNHLFEKIMIPRTEAYVFAYWALFCILIRRPLLAGILLGFSYYCQIAVGAYFGVPMLIWMLIRREAGPGRWKDAAWLIGGFALMLLYPLLTKSTKLLVHSTVSDEETIMLAGYIRHPHHMIPHLWGGMWIAFLFIAMLASQSWRKLKAEYPLAWSLGGMAVIMIAFLAIATFFIEIKPVKLIVMGQPYRMAVFLYFILFMVLAPYLLSLLQAPGALSTARAVCLVLALQHWKVFIFVGLVELVLAAAEQRRRPLSDWLGWLMLAAAVAGPILWDHDYKDVGKTAAPVLVVILLARRLGLYRRPKFMMRLAGGTAIAGAVFISSFFWLPYQKWINDDSNKHQRQAAMRCYDYQFNPIPIMALERLGVWAQAHTAKDALFLIPPEREMYGFHLWAKRSVVFSFKFFPYNAEGMKEWKERYLALHGIPDTKSQAAKQAIQEAMSDIGGELVNESFFSLHVEQILALLRRYDADYLITQARYRHPLLEELTADYNHTKSRKNGTLYYLYRFKKESAPGKPQSQKS